MIEFYSRILPFPLSCCDKQRGKKSYKIVLVQYKEYHRGQATIRLGYRNGVLTTINSQNLSGNFR